MKFTDRYIQKLQPREKRFEILEGDGFTLRVTPTGVKSFYYVYKAGGKNHRLHLGTYPYCSLAEARDKHREALSQRHGGENPALERRRQKVEHLKAPTVRKLAETYLEKHAKVHKRSWKNDEQILEKDVLPVWGDRKAEEIRKRDVILLLESILNRGAPNQSGQTLKIIRKMFNWAVERDILENSPCHLVKPLAPSTSKERALSDKEIRAFWRVLTTTSISDSMRRGLLLILVTGQRPGECLGMLRQEINGEWWTIPPERTKNKREHRVWLSPLALDLMGDLSKSGPVFPRPVKKPRDKDAPEPEKSVMDKAAPAKAVRRLVTAQGKKKIIRLPIPAFTPHDLRRTCATQLGALGYDNQQIGRLLNHVDDKITAIYNRHRYDELIQEMLLAWENRLREILAGKDSAAD